MKNNKSVELLLIYYNYIFFSHAKAQFRAQKNELFSIVLEES